MKQNALTQFRDSKNLSKTYEKFLLQLQYSGKHMRASAATFRIPSIVGQDAATPGRSRRALCFDDDEELSRFFPSQGAKFKIQHVVRGTAEKTLVVDFCIEMTRQ